MKAVAVRPGKKNSVHLADVPCRGSRMFPAGAACWSRCCGSASTPPTAKSTSARTATRRRATTFWCWGTSRSAASKRSAPKSRTSSRAITSRARSGGPGNSIFDQIGRSDITSEETYYERGINLLHGFLTEYYVDDCQFIVRMPVGLKHLHVLAEPMSCAAKAVQQAYEAQRRLQVWGPKLAFVTGRRADRPACRR